MEYCSRTTQRMNLLRLLLLLTFSTCVPGALGSGHSHLRSRRLLLAFAAPGPNDSGTLVAPSPVSDLQPPPYSSPPPPSPPPPPPAANVPSAPAPSPPLESRVPPQAPASSIQPHQPFPSPSPFSPPPPILPSEPLSQPSPPGSAWNESEKAGVVIAAVAALLQVAVVACLLIKRHQMMTAVEYEDYDDDYDHAHPDYRHPGHSV